MGRVKVDLQTDPIGIEASRIIAAVHQIRRSAALPPHVVPDGALWIVGVQERTAVPGSELRHTVGTLADRRNTLKYALDILIDGI